MSEEKKKILNKIDKLITEKRIELLNELSSVHKANDDNVIRFF